MYFCTAETFFVMKTIVLILVMIIAVSSRVTAQDMDDASIDSLASIYYSLDDNDTAKLRISNCIAKGHYNVDSTIAWAERQIRLAKIQQNALSEAYALGYLSWAYYFKSNFLEANNCNFRAIIIADSIGDDQIKADNYRMLGDNYGFINDYQQSHQYYSIALDLYEKLRDSSMIAACTRTMAHNFSAQKMYGQAEDYYRKALLMDSLVGDVDYLLADHTGLAAMFLTQYLYNATDKNTKLIEKAKHEVAMGDSTKSDFLYNVYGALEIKSHVLTQEAIEYGYEGQKLQDVLDSIRDCYETGYEIIEKLQCGDEICFDICKVNYLTLSRRHDEAKHILDSLLASIDGDFVNGSHLEMLYIACDNYYTSINDYKNAYYYKSLFYEYINDQALINYAVKVAQDVAQAKFNEEVREHGERERLRAKIIRYSVIGVVLATLFFVVEFFRTRRHNRILNQKNDLLERQKLEITSQKEEISAQSDELAKQNKAISQQNSSIKESIVYARLIQCAMMPDEDEIRATFSEYYLIYRPLHIVAGDFYWMETIGKYKMVVCADSTGHGVPGAFVSMLGISLLNDIAPLAFDNDGSPALILNEMRGRLMSALGQSVEKYERGEKMNLDGIDLALVIIDTQTNTMKFSGAYRPLWYYSNGSVTELKPDKMPIGVYWGSPQSFTEHTVQIHPGDVLYMFSDGITDQFGYTDEAHTKYKHFSIKRLFKLVGDIAAKPFDEQHSILESTIDNWQNGYQQLDDIIFLAVKL